MGVPTEISLFSGGGGGCLASVLLRHRTVCYVENNEYAARVLQALIRDRMLDDAPFWDDIRTFDGRPWCGLVDIVSGGFPCQAFSTASRGRKTAADLWPEMLRVIWEVRPAKVFAENVQLSPLKRAAEDLYGIGYTPRIGLLRASDLGAAHKRPRYWLFADIDSNSECTGTLYEEVACLRKATHAKWRETPSDLILGMDVRNANRVDRLRAIGNSQVPIVAKTAWELMATFVK